MIMNRKSYNFSSIELHSLRVSSQFSLCVCERESVQATPVFLAVVDKARQPICRLVLVLFIDIEIFINSS